VRERRTLLTADRRLVRRHAARDHILITSHDLDEQIRQVLREQGLTVNAADLLGRCLLCNRPTETLERDAARAEVPVYVFRTQSRFTRCAGCGRVFWRATHVTRMLEKLEAATGVPPAREAAPRRVAPAGRRKAPARRALPRPDAARFAMPAAGLQAEAGPVRAVAGPMTGAKRAGPRRRRP
jgi:uncharacterized protein with PIN domain